MWCTGQTYFVFCKAYGICSGYYGFMELYMGKPQEKHYQGSPRLQLQNSCSQPFQLTLSTLKYKKKRKKNEIKLDWSNIQQEYDLICKAILVNDLPLLVLVPILNSVNEYLVQVPNKIPIEQIPKKLILT